MNNFFKIFIKSLLWFILTLSILISFEVIFVSIITGYSATNFSFLLWNKFHFFLAYLLDEPLETLSFILINKPLFEIEAILTNPTQVVWGLHYYGFTLLIHSIIAVLISKAIMGYRTSKTSLKHYPLSGSILLILSSLHLYLASCCTAGANWIIHTWLLAIIFNPYTSSETMLEIYNYVENGFIWLQLMMVSSGIYLIFLKIRKEPIGLKQKIENGSE